MAAWGPHSGRDRGALAAPGGHRLRPYGRALCIATPARDPHPVPARSW